jgi:Tfp pilus assembly protein PilZ
MNLCPACHNGLPLEAKFCGFCGFRLAPIAAATHRALVEKIDRAREGSTAMLGVPNRPLPFSPPELLERSATPVLRAPEEGASWNFDEAPTPNAPNRRLYRRFPLRGSVSFGAESTAYQGEIADLSLGGLFLATALAAELNSRVFVSFQVPNLDYACHIPCRVRWRRPVESASLELPPGLGLEFETLTARDQGAIQLFLMHREQFSSSLERK